MEKLRRFFRIDRNKISAAEILLLLVGFIITYASFFRNGFTEITLHFLVISVFLWQIVQKLKVILYENLLDNAIKKYAPNNFDLRYIGTIAEAINISEEAFGGAMTVYNTVFTRSQNNENFIREDMHTAFLKAVRKTINDAKWYDVAVETEISSVDEFFESLSDHQRSNYNVSFLPKDFIAPLFQVTVIFYADGRGAVLFGWRTIGGKNSRVYHSEDMSTVNYFHDYFNQIRSMARTRNMPPPNRPETVQ